MPDFDLMPVLAGAITASALGGLVLLTLRLRARRQENAILRRLLRAEMERTTDLINTNYMLATLNEDLFACLDQHNPLITPLRTPILN